MALLSLGLLFSVLAAHPHKKCGGGACPYLNARRGSTQNPASPVKLARMPTRARSLSPAAPKPRFSPLPQPSAYSKNSKSHHAARPQSFKAGSPSIPRFSAASTGVAPFPKPYNTQQVFPGSAPAGNPYATLPAPQYKSLPYAPVVAQKFSAAKPQPAAPATVQPKDSKNASQTKVSMVPLERIQSSDFGNKIKALNVTKAAGAEDVTLVLGPAAAPGAAQPLSADIRDKFFFSVPTKKILDRLSQGGAAELKVTFKGDKALPHHIDVSYSFSNATDVLKKEPALVRAAQHISNVTHNVFEGGKEALGKVADAVVPEAMEEEVEGPQELNDTQLKINSAFDNAMDTQAVVEAANVVTSA